MSELLPLDGWDNRRDEYLELRDLTPGDPPVAAYDDAFPDHTWRLRGSVDFDFPPAFRFPRAGRVVIVGFDPVLAPYDLAAFRARHRLDGSTVILGPWQGSLPDGGGLVRLLKPLAPERRPAPAGFEVPYAVIEEIHYQPGAPWPEGAAGDWKDSQSPAPAGVRGRAAGVADGERHPRGSRTPTATACPTGGRKSTG